MRPSPTFFRSVLLAALAACLLITGYSLARYPAILNSGAESLVYLGILMIVTAAYGVIGWRLTGNGRPAGLGWGLANSGLWAVQITLGNLADTRLAATRLAYYAAGVGGLALPLLAGLAGAWRARQFGAGLAAGLTCGLMSGLCACLYLTGLTYLLLDTFLRDPQNLAQFARSGAPDVATFVVGETLAAAINHLLIGLISGAGLGALGAFAGRAARGGSGGA